MTSALDKTLLNYEMNHFYVYMVWSFHGD